MLARYFFRAALILCGLISLPAFAGGWSAYVWGSGCPSPRVITGDSWTTFRNNALSSCPGVTACSIQSAGSYQELCTLITTGSYTYINYGYSYAPPVFTCDSPYVVSADGSTCQSPPPPPVPTTCTVYPALTFIPVIGGDGDQPSQACVQNCLIDTGSGMSWGISPNREWQSTGRSTGTFCSTNNSVSVSASDPACPAGQYHDVNNTCVPLSVCPYDSTIPAINVNCHPALCATDVSLYASSPLCQPSPASAVPGVVNCSTIPNDPICAGAASGTSPTITGTPGTSGVYATPTLGGVGGEGLVFDPVPDNAVLGSKIVNVSITPVSVGGSGSCPAPSVMVLHGQTYHFDWTIYCNFANMIKPILLAFAWLAAAGILVGGFVA